jgi:hypothetical protein
MERFYKRKNSTRAEYIEILLRIKIADINGKPVAVFGRVRKIRKSYYQLRHVCPSVRPRGITVLPLDGFLRKFIFECFF